MIFRSTSVILSNPSRPKRPISAVPINSRRRSSLPACVHRIRAKTVFHYSSVFDVVIRILNLLWRPFFFHLQLFRTSFRDLVLAFSPRLLASQPSARPFPRSRLTSLPGCMHFSSQTAAYAQEGYSDVVKIVPGFEPGYAHNSFFRAAVNVRLIQKTSAIQRIEAISHQR